MGANTMPNAADRERCNWSVVVLGEGSEDWQNIKHYL